MSEPTPSSLDPRLRKLPKTDLLEIIERQANAIRVLQNKARHRAVLLESLEREIREVRGD